MSNVTNYIPIYSAFGILVHELDEAAPLTCARLGREGPIKTCGEDQKKICIHSTYALYSNTVGRWVARTGGEMSLCSYICSTNTVGWVGRGVWGWAPPRLHDCSTSPAGELDGHLGGGHSVTQK